MFDQAKEKMMERAMSKATPSESDQAQALAHIIAGLENEQAQALQELVDAADVDVDAGDVRHDKEAREEQLLGTADAVAQQRLAEFYLDEMGLDKPEKATEYIGVDWSEQKREWYQKYRERDVVEGPPVDEADQDDINDAASIHVTHVFGVTLDLFESLVVNWDRGSATQELLAGPIAGHTELINHIAGEIGR